jgi:hypothetical protein
MVLSGAGVGMTVQNFVLVVQNSVPLSDIGASSATVSFFRSMGGTIGVAVLGAVLARQVSSGIAGGTATAAAYGTATAHVFAISAAVALVGVLAAVLLKPVTLRSSHELADSIVGADDGVADLAGKPVGVAVFGPAAAYDESVVVGGVVEDPQNVGGVVVFKPGS